MSKKFIFIVLVIAMLAVALSACSNGDIKKAVNDGATKTLLTNTTVEQQVENWVESTCRQRADGTCKTMGEQ